jgi:hypothetical protein
MISSVFIFSKSPLQDIFYKFDGTVYANDSKRLAFGERSAVEQYTEPE